MKVYCYYYAIKWNDWIYISLKFKHYHQHLQNEYLEYLHLLSNCSRNSGLRYIWNLVYPQASWPGMDLSSRVWKCWLSFGFLHHSFCFWVFLFFFSILLVTFRKRSLVSALKAFCLLELNMVFSTKKYFLFWICLFFNYFPHPRPFLNCSI